MQPVTYDKFIELYKLIIETENRNHAILITVLLGVFIILLGLNWFWNRQQVSNKIKEIEKKNSEIREELKIEITKKFEEKEIEITKKFEEKEIQFKEELEDTQGLILVLSASVAKNNGNLGQSLFFLCKSMEGALSKNNISSIRDDVDSILTTIRSKKFLEKKSVYLLSDVKEIIKKLPDLIKHEKEEILGVLDSCTDQS